MVGTGRHPSYVHAGVVADLCELSGAAALLEQRTDPDAGRGSRPLWRAGCAAGLFLHLVFPDAASATGDRRRWIDGSAHAAHATHQLAGISLLRISDLLVALPPRAIKAGCRAGTRHGVAGRSGCVGETQHALGSGSTMNAIKFLFAAYIATWVIHVSYIGTLVLRFRRLRQQLKELGQAKSTFR